MAQAVVHFLVHPGGSLHGNIQVPGDKSISHRAVMLGAIAEGKTEIHNFLAGADCLATINAFRAMGINIEGPVNNRVHVHGLGLQGLKKPAQPLDMGNSGTSMRLITGILAGQTFDSIITGDESLLKRPMGRVVIPLTQMGAKITMQADGTAPLYVQGQQTLVGINYEIPVASAQVKSSLLLAGLYAQGETVITEPAITRDHTERMLRAFSYAVASDNLITRLQGLSPLKGTVVKVPADISSAAFFIVAATIAAKSDIFLPAVGINPSRIGVINILRMMGANIEVQNQRKLGDEPVADLRVRAAKLTGIEIPITQVPLAIDEFPALFIAAACADGITVLRGAKELRVKESDRINAMAEGLTTLGIKASPLADGIIIEGGEIGGGEINSYGDHRIAMAFAIAGLVAKSNILINDCYNVATSFPNFLQLAQQAGLAINSKHH